MILDVIQLKKNIARLKCGNKIGTAFLIEKNIAITALHCIEHYSEFNSIELSFLNWDSKIVTIKSKPLEMKLSINLGIDIIMLKLEETAPEFEYLTFSEEIISNNAKWNTYGYPGIEKADGMPLTGYVRQENNEHSLDAFDLILGYDGLPFTTDGLSGSPILIGGVVKGVMTYNRGKRNTLGAYSTKN